ncbi:MAG: hypothetical protein ACR2P1_27150, partial [Pseudomonadales bacterium]
YEDDLENIRTKFGSFEQRLSDKVTLEDTLSSMIDVLLKAERSDPAFSALANATRLIPELHEADSAHGQMISESIAALLKKLGSSWSMKKLRRVSLYLYCVNFGSWQYREITDGGNGESRKWEKVALLAILLQCFE